MKQALYTVVAGVSLLVAAVLPAGASAGAPPRDWDPGGGGYTGYYEPPAPDPGPADWTPFYYGW